MPHRATCGFSLIELLVVISIIVALIGVGVVAMQAASRRANISATEAVIIRLNAIHDEYVMITGGPTRMGGNPAQTMTRFMEDVRQLEKTAGMLESFRDDLRPNGVVDAFGEVILMGGVEGRRARWFWSKGPNRQNDSADGSVIQGDDIGGPQAGGRS